MCRGKIGTVSPYKLTDKVISDGYRLNGSVTQPFIFHLN